MKFFIFILGIIFSVFLVNLSFAAFNPFQFKQLQQTQQQAQYQEQYNNTLKKYVKEAQKVQDEFKLKQSKIYSLDSIPDFFLEDQFNKKINNNKFNDNFSEDDYELTEDSISATAGYRILRDKDLRWMLGLKGLNFLLGVNKEAGSKNIKPVIDINYKTSKIAFTKNASEVKINSKLVINPSDVEGEVLTATTSPKLSVDGNVRWSGTLQSGSVPWVRLVFFPNPCQAMPSENPEGIKETLPGVLVGFNPDGTFKCRALIRGPKGPQGNTGCPGSCHGPVDCPPEEPEPPVPTQTRVKGINPDTTLMCTPLIRGIMGDIGPRGSDDCMPSK